MEQTLAKTQLQNLMNNRMNYTKLGVVYKNDNA